jgi:CxxC-x17-CxxC domain-containing protein
MLLQEQSIDCFDCGVAFTFTMEEKMAYQAKGHFHVPKRCPSCRETRKTRQMKDCTFKKIQSDLPLFSATCTQCGKSTQVPFEPKANRPVYCHDCYHKIKTNR